MEPAISGLINTINLQCEAYGKLCDLALQKKDCILQNDVEALEDIIKEEQRFIQEVLELERTRLGFCAELSALLGINDKTVTLTSIKNKLSQEDADYLDKCHSKLIDVIIRLKDHNDLNNSLIRHSLAYLNYSLQLLTGYGNDVGTYGDKGDCADVGESRKSIILDSRA